MNRYPFKCIRKYELSRYLLKFEKDYYHDIELEVELTLKKWYKSHNNGYELLCERIKDVQYHPLRNFMGRIVGYFQSANEPPVNSST